MTWSKVSKEASLKKELSEKSSEWINKGKLLIDFTNGDSI